MSTIDNFYILLAIVITQVILVPLFGLIFWKIKHNPEIKRIKQAIADKKTQIETNKDALIHVCCSRMCWDKKQPLIDFYKEELNKLKKEIIKLNDELPKNDKEDIKVNVSEILTAVEEFKAKEIK